MGLFDGCRCCPSLCFRPKPNNVKTLDFSHCCLEDVPNNVFSHERTLEEINLDSNQIRDLPRALFHCEGLHRLNVSDNELQSIPSAVSSLIKLEELNISKNHILQIPDSIKSCKCLMIIEASINPLGPRLPDGFTQLINLQELYLNDAFLEFLPANFGRLSRLQIVELRENHLKLLPKSMSRLVELRRLDIGQNDFLEFPEVIGSLSKLSELWCDCNRIISIPNSIGNLKNLTYLDASYNKIEEISPEIGECLELTDLTLTSNNLIELPETIGSLVKLNTLRIDENEIKCFPYSIGSLISLEELVFNENEIETIPSNIGLLRNLKTLIGDCNKLIELPVSIGSCMQMRILSLAENQLKSLPDEIGRLSSLKVLNLNSNSLNHLPLSLTKIANLQALWLSENQTKPLIQFQSEIDRESGQKVLTCFLLPQIPLQVIRNSPKNSSPNDTNNENNGISDKQVIKFSNDSTNLEIIDDDLEDRITTKLIRAPTPYPKELKAHARHARNLALKQKDPNSSTMSSNGLENCKKEMIFANNKTDDKLSEFEQNSSHFEIREAKVSKAPKSPSNSRHNSEPPKRPTSLPMAMTTTDRNDNYKTDVVNTTNLQLIASKITELLKNEENDKIVDSNEKSAHERKASYKVAVNSSTASMKSPIERKIKAKTVVSKDDNDRGYRSDVELYSNQRVISGSITGYSSDCELTARRVMSRNPNKVMPKECDSDSALIQKPYESNLNTRPDSHSYPIIQSKQMRINCKTDNKSNAEKSKTSDSLIMQSLNSNEMIFNANKNNSSEKSKTNCDIINDKPIATNDMNSNSSLGRSSGSDRPVSLCSGRSPYNSSTTSANSSANTSQRSLSPNEITVLEANNQTPALPPKPLNYSALRQESGVPTPGVSNARLRHPQTASSQFIIHKFCHDSYTAPKPSIGHNSTSHPFVYSDNSQQNKWNTNGINFIDDSNDSISSNSSNSLLNPNNHLSHLNRFVSSSTAHVFPVIIVKNPGLGFSIECGSGGKTTGISTDSPNDSVGIYVSNVEPAGSASTALKVGDKILQIDGIDLQNVTQEKVNHIFQSTGNTISLMVSREKT